MVKLKMRGKPEAVSKKPKLIRKPEPAIPATIPKKVFHPSEKKVSEPVYETKQVNIRLPENVLDYYRDNFSPGYQTKIKEILAEYMEANPL